MATRPPKASAAISRIMARFTVAPRLDAWVSGSVGGGEWFGLCDLHGLRVAAELPLAALGDSHGGLTNRARVALAHQVCHGSIPPLALARCHRHPAARHL